MQAHIPDGFVQVIKNSHFDPYGYVDVLLERQYKVMHPEKRALRKLPHRQLTYVGAGDRERLCLYVCTRGGVLVCVMHMSVREYISNV